MVDAESEWVRNPNARIELLLSKGVIIVSPHQTWIAPEVISDRIHSGAKLHPGTRIIGRSTWLGSGVEIGTEGPATVSNSIFDERSVISSGYVHGAVVLRDAKLGGSAHVRAGTLIEEEVSTAHAVGLKQTILLSYVTLGSLINYCDCLMAGGTSRENHSEVGSGYIHFNFTPWGRRGDKATPSLVGDVTHGVFLRSNRIFLGGAGGMVGPSRVGFGSIAAAGQILRQDLPDNCLFLAPAPKKSHTIAPFQRDRVEPRASKNIEYLAQLYALREWYCQVRLKRIPVARQPTIESAIECINICIQERIDQLGYFLNERGVPCPKFGLNEIPRCPLPVAGTSDHIEWVKSLSDDSVKEGVQWLRHIVDIVMAEARSHFSKYKEAL